MPGTGARWSRNSWPPGTSGTGGSSTPWAGCPAICSCRPAYRPQAYEDYPLPIGEGQTISQPYIVALMTQCLELEGGEKVLEIGTGSGYQAAVLAELRRPGFFDRDQPGPGGAGRPTPSRSWATKISG